MIPRTFPSTFAANGQQQMVVYSLPSITGLRAWIDYIPVKGVVTESATLANTYANGGYQIVNSLASLTGKQAWLDYIPVYEDPSYNKPWSTDAGGYIPTSALAALLLDFTSGRLDPRITFSRTTNATVTGSNGLIQNAPMNLLRFSEQFDNAAWTNISSGTVTVSANATTAPDGTTTADQLTGSAANAPILAQFVPVDAFTYVFSIWLRANTPTTVELREGGIILGTASVTSTWQRFSATFTPAAGTRQLGVRLLNNAVVFAWGAQLELGSTATTYNPTTVKNLLGFTENFDNAAWTKSNAFVQTNLLTYSQDFDNAGWTKTASTVTANTTTAPDGSLTADKLVEDTTNNLHNVQGAGNPAVTSGVVYTASVYLKAAERTSATVRTGGGGLPDSGAIVDLSAGVISSQFGSPTSVSISSAGSGWYRVSIVNTSASTTTGRIYVALNASTPASPDGQTYTGNGTSGIFIWGAQLVQGATPGDYKATYAAAAAVGYTDIYGQPFAQKLVENTATGSHNAVQAWGTSSASAPYTVSVYLKDAGARYVIVQVYEGVTGGQIFGGQFDLLNGVTAGVCFSGGTTPTTTIISVGNGWYRCTVTYRTTTGGGSSQVQVLTNRTGTFTTNPYSYTGYTGDGTSGIYIFGAQLSDSASVDPYVYQPVAAPTSTAYYGPRFDYDPVTLAPKGLLIEEQRTNLCLYSESFQSGPWTQNNVTDIANSTVAPNGTTTADTLVASVGTAAHTITSGALNPAAGIAASVYAKMGTASVIQLFVGGTATPYANFDLSVGTATAFGSGTAASITPVGNGWYRCVMTTTLTNATSLQIGIVPSTSSARAASWTATGTETVFIWGAQLEAGAFATSYIPTVASQVTRAADSASMIGNNFARWYTQDIGTLYSDASQMGAAATTYRVFNFAGTNTPNISQFGTASNTGINGVFSIASSAYAVNVYSKTAFAYQISNFAMSKDGATATANTSATVLGTPTIVGIGQNGAGAQFLNGHIKRIAYYPRRLANTELQGITS